VEEALREASPPIILNGYLRSQFIVTDALGRTLSLFFAKQRCRWSLSILFHGNGDRGASPEDQSHLLGAPKTEAVWDLQAARQQISEAGLRVTSGREARLESWFKDVGAVVFFLLAVPWQLEGFTVALYLDKLKELHQLIARTGSFSVTARRFYLSSMKQ